MGSTLFLIFLAILGGIAVTLQGHFMGLLDRGLGTRESVFITYGSGGFVAALMMVASGGGNLRGWASVPWYSLSAGLLGLLIVGTIGYVVPRLGLAKGVHLDHCIPVHPGGPDRPFRSARWCGAPSGCGPHGGDAHVVGRSVVDHSMRHAHRLLPYRALCHNMTKPCGFPR